MISVLLTTLERFKINPCNYARCEERVCYVGSFTLELNIDLLATVLDQSQSERPSVKKGILHIKLGVWSNKIIRS